ncbi:hypothetical protein HA151_03275 [Prochlorococcus marinus XMU1419]|uniref:hypothetical protein n=1 Tax=Prochlorococcus marinus TaxID=1219 RepID=UPI001ADBFF92|nr:hypothetical protein [Prochlorococcus marinus]MBO8233536.1 hypothetical protein [Prochlorococcus marinus XMU1419]MBW3077016.1 hypothetical protein [Prochlorococcus marinus str. XMU1419]
MLGDIWISSELTAEKLGITEIKLSFLRENGILKPGIHWKSSPLGQKKPWNPKALFNIERCRNIVNKFYFEENYDLAA